MGIHTDWMYLTLGCNGFFENSFNSLNFNLDHNSESLRTWNISPKCGPKICVEWIEIIFTT